MLFICQHNNPDSTVQAWSRTSVPATIYSFTGITDMTKVPILDYPAHKIAGQNKAYTYNRYQKVTRLKTVTETLQRLRFKTQVCYLYQLDQHRITISCLFHF